VSGQGLLAWNLTLQSGVSGTAARGSGAGGRRSRGEQGRGSRVRRAGGASPKRHKQKAGFQLGFLFPFPSPSKAVLLFCTNASERCRDLLSCLLKNCNLRLGAGGRTGSGGSCSERRRALNRAHVQCGAGSLRPVRGLCGAGGPLLGSGH